MKTTWIYEPRTRNVLAADGEIICRNGDSVYGDPMNGKLIAATPELLEACRYLSQAAHAARTEGLDVADKIVNSEHPDPIDEALRLAIDRADAAIAQAIVCASGGAAPAATLRSTDQCTLEKT